MKILLLEPFFTGSHKRWAESLQKVSNHQIEIRSLPGNFWKWRMHGAAITLSSELMNMQALPDLILATDMLDVALFKSLLPRKFQKIPIATYFHENQISYPWSPNDPDTSLQRDRHYGFINYTSALVSDRVYFNSKFHRDSFLEALPKFLNGFPDFKNLHTVKPIADKCSVLSLGMDLSKYDNVSAAYDDSNTPIVLWNHRWEYDKNPDLFFEILFQLSQEQVAFKLIVLGEKTTQIPNIFHEAKSRLQKEIIHFDYTQSFQEYVSLIKSATVLPVTSIQDFFGISVVEAMYSGVYPLVPSNLAYAEHIPTKYHCDYFYKDQEDLKERLRDIINKKPIQKIDSEISKQLMKYDWKNLVKIYDFTFEELVFNKK